MASPGAQKSCPRAAHSLLGAPVWRALLARLELHRTILSELRAALPTDLAGHCRDCLLKERRLVIFLDDPVWCFQARFHLPALRSRLVEGGRYAIDDIQVRSLMDHRATDDKGVSRPLTPETIEVVRSSALGNESSEIGQALLRLAETMAKK